MGGKKKTKWRKLPLADFTKECPITERIVSIHESKIDDQREALKQPPIAVHENPSEIVNQYSTEHREYTEDVLYSSPYIVYNSVEPLVYSNYVAPEDACCYYYFPPDMAPVQEYTPVPYQEYVPLVKDIVYLLLPTPAVRSTHGFTHVAYDWRNRRRTRKYEGYAECSTTSDKTGYFGDKEVKDQKKRLNASAGRNSCQYSDAKPLTSFTEISSHTKQNKTQVLQPSTIIPEKTGMAKSKGETSEYELDNQNLKERKNKEFCGVHSARTLEKSDSRNHHSETGHKRKNDLPANILDDDDSYTNILPPEIPIQPQPMHNILKDDETNNGTGTDTNNVINNRLDDSKKTFEINTSNLDARNNYEITCELTETQILDATKEIETRHSEAEKCKSDIDQVKGNSALTEVKENPKSYLVKIPSSLPNLQSNIVDPNTTSNEISVPNNTLSSINSVEKLSQANGKNSKSEAILSYVSHSFNSDSFSSETEVELKKLQSLKANQSIYKLAYDESITDQSSSRSPSPVDPETQMRSSITNSEILIHEAGSDSEAGSEDIELIPHRYESETFLNENKHMYVNKLSLAVELLRTQESLPYDEQFKRVIGESNLNSKETKMDTTGEVNFGFVDSYSTDSFDGTTGYVSNAVVETSRHSKKGEIAFRNSDSCEMAKEVEETTINPDRTDETRASNRRFPFRHYFSSRAALVNPCLCCIIM